MPAYVRLLAYFSNFILLATFLGIGIGCLLADRAAARLRLVSAVAAGRDHRGRRLRLEVASSAPDSIYFTSGTQDSVIVVESTMLLPVLFLARRGAVCHRRAADGPRDGGAAAVARLHDQLCSAALPASLRLALLSWLQMPPASGSRSRSPRRATLRASNRAARAARFGAANIVLLASSLGLVHQMEPAPVVAVLQITRPQEGPDTVIEVNNIFHQSMAPVGQKEYFYQWPYTVFGDTFDDVLILGAGSGTDVAAALRHGAKHVDAVEIDPVIIRLGRERHPDHPYSDPRVTVINDDARHFLRRRRRNTTWSSSR